MKFPNNLNYEPDFGINGKIIGYSLVYYPSILTAIPSYFNLILEQLYDIHSHIPKWRVDELLSPLKYSEYRVPSLFKKLQITKGDTDLYPKYLDIGKLGSFLKKLRELEEPKVKPSLAFEKIPKTYLITQALDMKATNYTSWMMGKIFGGRTDKSNPKNPNVEINHEVKPTRQQLVEEQEALKKVVADGVITLHLPIQLSSIPDLLDGSTLTAEKVYELIKPYLFTVTDTNIKKSEGSFTQLDIVMVDIEEENKFKPIPPEIPPCRHT